VSGDDRERKLTQAQGTAALRSMHLRGLSEAGTARASALAEAEKQLDRIARLLHDALQGGVTMSEIARVTGVSRQTLYELRGRYGDTLDLRLAVLQALLTQYPATIERLEEHLGRPTDEIKPLLSEFLEKGFADESPDPDVGLAYAMTPAGLRLLQDWARADDPTADALWEES
jgi:AcrR family transcriptional regulator